MDEDYFELEIPVLNVEYSVLVSIGKKDKTLVRARGIFEKVDDEDVDNKRGCYWAEHGKKPMIWIGVDYTDKHFYATVAHEAVHAIQHIFDEIEETHSKEIFAHCVGAVVAGVEDFIVKHTESDLDETMMSVNPANLGCKKH
jgi:hypothetical protein